VLTFSLQTEIATWTVNRDLVTHVLFVVKEIQRTEGRAAIFVDTTVSYVMDEPRCRREEDCDVR
jgi:hypothetical protein